MQVVARHSLVDRALDATQPALLLEGSWPGEADVPGRWSLDDSIDSRHAWLDDEADRLAELVCAQPASLAWVNAPRLRYFLIKLLRVVAFFDEVWRPTPGSRISVALAAGRDDEYAQLMEAIGRTHALDVQTEMRPGPQPAESHGLTSAWWRRAAARLHRWTEPRLRNRADGRPRVILCGNPRHLDPVCGELLRRGAQVHWLYERFAFGTWRRWRAQGVGQLICDRRVAELARVQPPLKSGDFSYDELPLECRGVDVGPAVACFLARVAADVGVRQGSLRSQITAHCRRVRPTHLVLDQDATPLGRLAVAASRAAGARSAVVQHGAPFIRMGFAPLEAVLLCAWDDASRRQFERWAVPAERIRVTGSPAHDASSATPVRRGNQRRFLLLTTTSPRDDRPEPVTYHATSRTHAEGLRMALAAVAHVSGATLTIKLHPRDGNLAPWQQLLNEFPELPAKLVNLGELNDLLSNADCVLSCASSGGIDAALAGLPVVQIMPAGSGDLLPAEDWGLVGTARCRKELDTLIARALPGMCPTRSTSRTQDAAARVVDALLENQATDPSDLHAIRPVASRPWAHV